MSQPPVQQLIQPQAYNENSMLEYMKISMMTNMIGNIDMENNTMVSIASKLLLILAINVGIKYLTDILNSMKTYLHNKKWFSKVDYTNKDATEFEFTITLTNSEAIQSIDAYIHDKNIYMDQKHLVMTNQLTSELHTNIIKKNGMANNIQLYEGYIARIFKIRYRQYIYYTRSPASATVYCNTKLSDLGNFIEKVITEYKNKINIEPRYYSGLFDTTGTFIKSKIMLDSVFIEQKDEIKKIIDRFNDVDWYNERCLPRHLGLLLYGPPGTCKTSFIKALSKYVKKDIYAIDCASLKTKQDLDKILTDPINCMTIFEDFDRIPCIVDLMAAEDKSKIINTKEYLDKLYIECIKEKDKDKQKEMLQLYEKNKKESESKLDLAYILNKLDGINERPGRLLIFTANHIERISEALLRPGRIDYQIEFKKTNREVIKQIIKYMFKVDRVPSLNKVREYYYSHAQIYAICKQCDSVKKVISILESGKNECGSVKI